MEITRASISNLPEFSGIDNSELAESLTMMDLHKMEYKEENIIVSQGHPCHTAFLILSGAIQTRRTSATGKITVIEEFVAPCLLAEKAIFTDQEYPYSIVALQDCTALLMSKKDMQSLMSKEPVFAQNMMTLLCEKYTKDELEFCVSENSFDERFINWLLSLTQSRRQNICICGNMKDLYGRFGVQRSLFYRMLSELEENKILKYDRDGIYINNRDVLDYYSRFIINQHSKAKA